MVAGTEAAARAYSDEEAKIGQKGTLFPEDCLSVVVPPLSYQFSASNSKYACGWAQAGQAVGASASS